MVTNSPLARHRGGAPTWQQELAAAITDPAELLRALDLVPAQFAAADAAALQAAAGAFPLRVPHSFLRRMRRGDPHDPLLRQVLALPAERLETPGFVADPLDEAAARRAPGLLHKYQGRALLVTTGACAVHCRYCFRREYDYGSEGGPRWDAALAAVAADSTIEELILSGGDPLSLSNARLAELLQRAAALPALRRLRIHTRTPVVLPARVDAGLVQLLAALPLPLVIVIHANHAAEFDPEVDAALRALRGTGAMLLNQSVLLAGVNDSADALVALSQRLFAAGVLPYYLHLLDPVRGTAHFDVEAPRARQLLQAVAARLPGFLVPRLVRELAGQPGKTPV